MLSNLIITTYDKITNSQSQKTLIYEMKQNQVIIAATGLKEDMLWNLAAVGTRFSFLNLWNENNTLERM